MKRGEGVEMSKLDIEKLTRLTKQVFFGECLNYFCPWLYIWLSHLCMTLLTSNSCSDCDTFLHWLWLFQCLAYPLWNQLLVVSFTFPYFLGFLSLCPSTLATGLWLCQARCSILNTKQVWISDTVFLQF